MPLPRRVPEQASSTNRNEFVTKPPHNNGAPTLVGAPSVHKRGRYASAAAGSGCAAGFSKTSRCFCAATGAYVGSIVRHPFGHSRVQ